MLKPSLIKIYNRLSKVQHHVPAHLSANFSIFRSEHLQELESMIISNLLKPLSADYHLTAEGKEDILIHLNGRLERFRAQYIPWINKVRELKGLKVLEIGCGTGSSTQALCEQGALVTALDIDQASLAVAEFRLRHSSQNARLVQGNSVELSKHFQPRSFDCVIFFASLEHMTTEERIVSLNQAYELLSPGGKLFVLEAPNRLWFFDMHTSFLPFYFWLPDDLAARYAYKSERKLFTDAVNRTTQNEQLARWGRGVSYHEFELAFIPDKALSDALSLFQFQSQQSRFQRCLYRLNLNYKYKKIIRKLAPAHISAAFLEPFLDLVITKR